MKEHFAGQPVLVTGSTGFVGGHLARRLVDLGADVRLLIRDPETKPFATEMKAKGAIIIPGDLRDLESVTTAVTGTKFVFHIGAIFREAKFADSVYFDINVGGTKNILEAAMSAGTGRVIHCSTNGVHGGHSSTPISENAPFKPSDVYQESKVEAENVVMHAYRSGRVDVSIIRPAMIWGDGDLRFKKLFRGVARRRLPIIGDGNSWTHWIWVGDLVQSFLLAAITPAASGQPYLIAGRRPVPLHEVYETIADLAGVSVLPFKVPVKPIQLLGDLVESICRPLSIEPPIHRRRADFFIKHRIFDISKAQTELGFQPAADFTDECARLFRWYKDNGHLGY